MPQQDLKIVPVTLHVDKLDPGTATSSNSICMIKTANAEISFFNGIDDRTIQTVLRELKHL